MLEGCEVEILAGTVFAESTKGRLLSPSPAHLPIVQLRHGQLYASMLVVHFVGSHLFDLFEAGHVAGSLRLQFSKSILS